MTELPSHAAVLLLGRDASKLLELRDTLSRGSFEIVVGTAKAWPDRAFAAIVVLRGDEDGDTPAIVERIRSARQTRATPILLAGLRPPGDDVLDRFHRLGAIEVVPPSPDASVLLAKLEGHANLFRQLERDQRAADQMQRVVQGTKDYAIFMLDPQGRVASWNTGARLLKGYDEEEVLGRHLSMFYPEDIVASGWVDHELRVAAEAGRFEDEGWRVRKDGTRFWANVVITALWGDDGELLGFSKVTRDLTSRKRAEEASRQLAQEAAARLVAETHALQLAAEKERLRVTLASIGDAVISTDQAGLVQFMNPIAESLTGWTSGEARNRALLDVFPIVNESTRLPVENPALRALREGKIVGLANHTLLLARDGTECAIDDSAAPIRDSHGDVVGSVLVFRDIGSRRAGEKQRNARAAAIQALADAESVGEGCVAVLDAICRHMGWNVGLFWCPDPADATLSVRAGWSSDEAGPAAFLAESRALRLGRGEGLPGRAWVSRKPTSTPDFTADASLPRRAAAIEAGLYGALACPVLVGQRCLGVIEFFTQRRDAPGAELEEMIATVAGALGQFIERRHAEQALREQTRNAEALARVGRLLGEESDLHRLVQVVTDESTRLCGAQFGAFFYNMVDRANESYMLYTLSGIDPAAFADFPMPRNTEVFGPTFRGEGIVRLDDVTKDPRYGKSAPHHGMPKGHPPVRSYLAASVVSRSGEVHGGLFFGHATPGVFTAQHEELVRGIAGLAAVAIDNARLYQNVQNSAERLSLALGAAELGDWSWDAKTDVVSLSDRGAAIFGVSLETTLTWTELQARLHPDDRDRARHEVERVIEHRRPYAIEYRVLRGAETVWVGALGRGTYDASGQPVGMYGVVQDITERKRLEQSLSDSEARFRSLMEQAPFSIQILSPDGRTLRVNAAWEALWGLTLEQLADYNILEDEQLERRGVLQHIRAAFDGTPSMVPAIRYDPGETLPDMARHADPVRWVAAVAYPIKDDQGVVQQVVLVHDDVTARERAEAALRESEERLRLALEAGQMGVWDWDVRTGQLRWSDSLEPLHGLAPGEFGGTFEHFMALVHPEDRPGVGRAIQAALEQPGSFHTEFRNIQPDGRVHWIAGSGKVFADDDGAARRMIGIGLDISERRRSEHVARFISEASAALAEIVDFESTLQKVASLAVPEFADWAAVDVVEPGDQLRRVAVAHVDPAKVALAAEIQRRWPPAPGAPTGAWHILRTGESELVQDIDDEFLEASIPDPDMLEVVRRLGLRSYIGVPLVVRGKPRGVITFVMAESGQRYEASDLAVAQQLAHRTAVAIENTELYQELREADRRKDEFLATLAHELRNPLAPIRGGLDIIGLAGPQVPVVERARTMMARQLGNLVRLVDDLLDVSRITRDRIELRMEDLSLAEILQTAAETSGPAMQQSGNALAIELPPAPIQVHGDRVRLVQVFSNLLNNAAKYSPHGGDIAVTVASEGREAVVSIRDRGLGIPAESLESIFEMFSQVHRDTPAGQGGLGIGLTLVKRLVELHGGSVRAYSEGRGRGSQLVVRLPMLLGASVVAPAPSEAGAGQVAARRVLVVDDNADAALALEATLRLMGHETRICTDGPEAIALALEFRPHLILLDLGLPTLSGYDVCREVRKAAWADGTTIAALTGWGQEEDRRRSSDAGFDEHLVKPVALAELERLLRRAG